MGGAQVVSKDLSEAREKEAQLKGVAPLLQLETDLEHTIAWAHVRPRPPPCFTQEFRTTSLPRKRLSLEDKFNITLPVRLIKQLGMAAGYLSACR